MTRFLRCLLLLWCGAGSPLFANGRPPKGFLTGPYLQMAVGARSADDDTNLVTGLTTGHAVEPTFGFHFGWHIVDTAGVDFSGHYTSAGTGATQQHLVTLRMCGLWNPLITPLIASPKLRVLPFLLAGGVGQVNILPAGDQTIAPRVTQWSGGPSLGAGLGTLLFHDEIFVSVRAVVDWVHRSNVSQNIGGTPTTVYPGGWETQWNAHAGLGLHF